MKNSKFKNILAGVAIFMASVLTLGLVLGLCYSAGWFSSNEYTISNDSDEFSASSVILGEGKNSGIMLTSKTLYDEGADATTKDNSATYSIEATITPANTSDQSVTMSVAWADSTSTWASGKSVSDYVTITQDSTGSLTGTLACKKAFGEQVILTVTLDSDSTVYGTAAVDYVARVDCYSMDQGDDYVFGSYLNISEKISYGTGTIYGEFTEATVYFDVSYDSDYNTFIGYFLYSYVKEFADIYGLSIADFAAINIGTLSDGIIDSVGNLEIGAADNIIVADSFMDFVSAMLPDATQTQLDAFEDAYLNTIISNFLNERGYEHYAPIVVDYIYSYNGTVYSSGKIVSGCVDISASGLTVNGTGVSVGQSNYVF